MEVNPRFSASRGREDQISTSGAVASGWLRAWQLVWADWPANSRDLFLPPQHWDYKCVHGAYSSHVGSRAQPYASKANTYTGSCLPSLLYFRRNKMSVVRHYLSFAGHLTQGPPGAVASGETDCSLLFVLPGWGPVSRLLSSRRSRLSPPNYLVQ